MAKKSKNKWKKNNKLIYLKQVNWYAAKLAQCNAHCAPFWTILFGICSHWILYKSKPKFQTKCILIHDQRKKRSPTCIEMWMKNVIWKKKLYVNKKNTLCIEVRIILSLIVHICFCRSVLNSHIFFILIPSFSYFRFWFWTIQNCDGFSFICNFVLAMSFLF